MANDKIKISQKEFDEIYDIEEPSGIPKEDNITEDNKRTIETDALTYEETITYGDKKLEKEFEEEH